jgi:hypothetical protein
VRLRPGSGPGGAGISRPRIKIVKKLTEKKDTGPDFSALCLTFPRAHLQHAEITCEKNNLKVRRFGPGLAQEKIESGRPSHSEPLESLAVAVTP